MKNSTLNFQPKQKVETSSNLTLDAAYIKMTFDSYDPKYMLLSLVSLEELIRVVCRVILKTGWNSLKQAKSINIWRIIAPD